MMPSRFSPEESQAGAEGLEPQAVQAAVGRPAAWEDHWEGQSSPPLPALLLKGISASHTSKGDTCAGGMCPGWSPEDLVSRSSASACLCPEAAANHGPLLSQVLYIRKKKR